METNLENQFANDLAPAPARPQFLKVLCILSFIASGFWILVYLFGTFCLGFNEEKIAEIWDKVIQSQPQLENVNPVEFFHEVGKISVICLFLNIASLIGVIMMWRLNKIGFFIYAAAELATHFFGMNMSASANGSSSYGSLIFMVILDLAFIIMYAVNLKYMNKSAPAVS